MHGAVSFDEVLDRTLGGGAPVPPPARSAAARVTAAAAFGFFELGGAEAGDRTTAPAIHCPLLRTRSRDAARSVQRPLPRREAPAPSHPPSRRRSCLTPEQHVALGDLQALGAPLRSDFTRDELRTAFRALAHRYHPDRHPGATESLRAELATLFRRLRAAYLVLSRA